MGHYAAEMAPDGDEPVKPVTPYMTLECQTDHCPEKGSVWGVGPEHFKAPSSLPGLMVVPDFRCRGCKCQPVVIQSEGV